MLGFDKPLENGLTLKDKDTIHSKYYLRFSVQDKPGVLAKIAGVLGEHNISIASMVQPERREGESVPIVIITHESIEGNLKKAIEIIDQLDIVKGKSQIIRIEDNL